MQNFVAKRILGGIAWACAMLLTPSASSQDALPHGFAAPPSLPPPIYQPGLSSKEYLRLMAEANEARSAGLPASQPDMQLARAVAPPPTSAQSFVQNATADVDGSQTPANQPVIEERPGYPETSTSVVATGPKLSVGYESIWMRRSGDTGTSWSSGGALGQFGTDRAEMVRVGWYSNPMERYEFAFLGSLVWNRRTEHAQPATALFSPSASEPDWFESFRNSSSQTQFHTARLRSYELNKRWITDDLGNYFLGLQVIDYEESYRLQSIDTDGSGALGFNTSNLLAGLQGGLELWRPLSQRFAVGGQGLLGLYGNFAEGGWRVDVENAGGFLRADRRFQTAASFGLDAKVRYQLNSRWQAFGSYRWWYLAGMATVDDQAIGPIASDTPFALSTDAGFLLQGATVGLEIVF